jgi:hypothetical protein
VVDRQHDDHALRIAIGSGRLEAMTRPIRALHITASRAARPPAARVIFCDGGVDASYRDGIDLELSHWIPNKTPPRYKASTSTEIGIRFMESTGASDHDLVINNHVDVDGVLATFALLYPDVALRHRTTLVQAAEMGDFWGWGEPDAQHLFQALACLIVRLRERAVDPLEIYTQCYDCVHAVVGGARFDECADGLAALDDSVRRIDTSAIARSVIDAHVVHYAMPRSIASRALAAALHVPGFCVPLSRAALLPPQARAKHDAQRVQLVSVETDDGHHYDLWLPGYTWAETVDWWRPPGVTSTGCSNTHELRLSALDELVVELSQLETARGRWTVARTLTPFATLAGRGFPVVLSFLQGSSPAPSALRPDAIASRLVGVFGE